ncbi:unnamed protein product, partial [Mesorhabditis spiculigera]
MIKALNFDQSLSPKTRTLQKELFRALVVQLIVPTLFVFGPLCFFFISAVNGANTLTKGAKPPNPNLFALQPLGERIAEKPELADPIDDGSGNAHNIDTVEPAV